MKSPGRNHHGHAARQRRVAATRPDVFAGRMHSGQRGRTRGIHRHAWAAQIQAIRNPIGGDAMGATSRRMRTDAGMIERCALNSLIIVMRNADEDAEIGSALQIEHEPCILDSLPGRFEEEPLLRIDVGSFPRRNAEELRIELIDPFDESAALGDRFASQPGLDHNIARHSSDRPAPRRRLHDLRREASRAIRRRSRRRENGNRLRLSQFVLSAWSWVGSQGPTDERSL